jgi:hypothetical protein
MSNRAGGEVERGCRKGGKGDARTEARRKIVEKTIALRGGVRNFFRLIFGATLPFIYG